jgi:Mg-chelatase subunit ChlI
MPRREGPNRPAPTEARTAPEGPRRVRSGAAGTIRFVAVERYTYPFTAIVGQERMKLALILNAINPSIGGVLIRGEKGTAKSTAVRALARLLPVQEVVDGCRFGCHPEDREALCSECRERLDAGEDPLPTTTRRMRVVELPINASEDRVVGTIDLEAALKEGEKRFEPGVLAEANRNILYVDEVNLLDDHIVDVLLDAAAMGVNVVEREGVSVTHPSRFILVGTMNPEEGELRPQLLDRFGLCVDVEGIRDLEQRVSIVEQRAGWEDDPIAFYDRYSSAETETHDRIAEGIATYAEVEIPRSILRLIAQLSIALEVDGHRSDLVCARAAQAKAAYDRHDQVEVGHVTDVAEMVFAHRLHTAPFGKGAPNLPDVIARIAGPA